MDPDLRVLVVEDVESDAELEIRRIKAAGVPCEWRRVETERELRDALINYKPGLIISDFTLPQFSGLNALAIASAEAPDVPFIFVSGTIGEERAIEALRQGAVDYVLKTNLVRLGPAVRRALDEAASRAAHRKAEKHIRRLTYFDPLTGLAKRSLFCERVSQFTAAVGDDTAQMAVVVFDVERLSVINDSLGRFTGDLLLQAVADRLRRHFDDTSHLAHVEGGTFAAFMQCAGAADPTLQSLHRRVAAIFGDPLSVAGQDIPVFVKCGLAPLDGSTDADTTLQNAEAALHKAKSSAVRHLRHRPEMNSEMAQRLALEHRLRRALNLNQFRLFYQPQVARHTGRIVGAEALLRWIDPERGIVAPSTFLPMLESTGMIVPVGEWVLRRAVEDCRRWQRHGRPPIRIAVNVSPVQLNRPDFGEKFLALTGVRTPGGCLLDLEITEAAVLEESEALIHTLDMLRAEGVRIAIDDFGIGYSSLARLSELPVDMLKIDRSFTQRLTSDPASHAVIATIVALARALDLGTIAEGVETPEQLQILEALGCSELQGFLHGPPVSAEEFEILLGSELRSTG
jgi:diguanylate cyclase (GGDEF)-like protein